MSSLRKCLILAVFLVSSGYPEPNAGAGSQRKHVPGVFDYYILSLSWSPEYCAGPVGDRNRQQCSEGRRFGFIVHGLWPQYERGYPSQCAESSRVSHEVAQRMLPLMPNARLIQHEWDKHGTCTGLSQSGYFFAVEKARAAIRIPEVFKQPPASIEVRPEAVRQQFASANPSFGSTAIRVSCGDRYLREVRICMTRELKPRPCGVDMSDECRSNTLIMRPVR